MTVNLSWSGDSPVFVRPPPEYRKVGADGREMLLRARKAAYGLMTSANDFNVTFAEWLVALGFVRNTTDPAVFTWADGDLWIDCNIHVDDGEYMASTDDLRLWFQAAVGAEFDTKWENSITFSLGVGINQRDNADGTRTVAIDMSDSIEELAYAYDVVDGNFRPVDNPAEANAKYHEWSGRHHFASRQ